jgi:hypothetical protein
MDLLENDPIQLGLANVPGTMTLAIIVEERPKGSIEVDVPKGKNEARLIPFNHVSVTPPPTAPGFGAIADVERAGFRSLASVEKGSSGKKHSSALQGGFSELSVLHGT